ncbi:hypothetical protein D3C76_1695080 [compost metagenome]
MTRSMRTIALVTTIPINIRTPIRAETFRVSPPISRPIMAPITINGSENRIANGARPPPNVTTSTKYTIATAAAIARPN